jgi:hypothetical protein
MKKQKYLVAGLVLVQAALFSSAAMATKFKDMKMSQVGSQPTIEVVAKNDKWHSAKNTTLHFKFNASGKVKCCNRYIHYVGFDVDFFPGSRSYATMGEYNGVNKTFSLKWSILTKRKKKTSFKGNGVSYKLKTQHYAKVKKSAVKACNNYRSTAMSQGKKLHDIMGKNRSAVTTIPVYFGIVAGKLKLGKVPGGDQKAGTRWVFAKVKVKCLKYKFPKRAKPKPKRAKPAPKRAKPGPKRAK